MFSVFGAIFVAPEVSERFTEIGSKLYRMVVPMSANNEERLTVPRTEATQLIQRQIERLETIVSRHHVDENVKIADAAAETSAHEINNSFARALAGFRDFTEQLLSRLFTTTRLRDMFHRPDDFDFQSSPVHAYNGKILTSLVRDYRFRLESIAEHLELYPEPPLTSNDVVRKVESATIQGDATHMHTNVTVATAGGFSSMSASPIATRRVFIVHGHDIELKESVARVLERLKLDAIILHEQANKGRSVIEKFEDYADVRFAVVLMSPDDVGCVKGKEPDGLQPRARQNVIYELGFFSGKLGRGNVCVIYRGGVEIPSDYLGVLYLPYDAAGQWKFALAAEVKSSGVDVDLNLLAR